MISQYNKFVRSSSWEAGSGTWRCTGLWIALGAQRSSANTGPPPPPPDRAAAYVGRPGKLPPIWGGARARPPMWGGARVRSPARKRRGRGHWRWGGGAVRLSALSEAAARRVDDGGGSVGQQPCAAVQGSRGARRRAEDEDVGEGRCRARARAAAAALEGQITGHRCN